MLTATPAPAGPGLIAAATVAGATLARRSSAYGHRRARYLIATLLFGLTHVGRGW
jgi:hypothetical protein